MAHTANMGWGPKTRKATEKVIYLFEFFSIGTYEAWEAYYLQSRLKIEFRISLAHTNNPYAISAWLRRGDLLARELDAPEYSDKKLTAILPQLKSIMALQPDNFFHQIQALCLSAGVKVVHTPCLPQGPINGVARWIEYNTTPLIQLSDRYKRNARWLVMKFLIFYKSCLTPCTGCTRSHNFQKLNLAHANSNNTSLLDQA